MDEVAATEDGALDSSDEDGLLLGQDDLPPEAWSIPTTELVPILLQWTKRLAMRNVQLDNDKANLKASIEELQRKWTEYDAQCQAHLQDHERCHQVLRVRLEALEAEKAELEARSSQQETELTDVEERCRDANFQQAETDHRIQRLMEQMVQLLSASPSQECLNSQVVQVVQELGASDERLGQQLHSLSERWEAVRQDNRRIALQLSEEQQKTKNLHDALCSLQGELFSVSSNGTRSVRTWPRRMEGELSPNAISKPAQTFDMKSETVVLAAPEETSVSSLRERRRSDGAAAPASPPRGVSLQGAFPLSPEPAEIATDHSPMEEKLREMLEVAQFDSLVVRLCDGWYQFGEKVRVSMRMVADGDLYASLDQVNFIPFDTFIRSISGGSSDFNVSATIAEEPSDPATSEPATPPEATPDKKLEATPAAGPVLAVRPPAATSTPNRAIPILNGQSVHGAAAPVHAVASDKISAASIQDAVAPAQFEPAPTAVVGRRAVSPATPTQGYAAGTTPTRTSCGSVGNIVSQIRSAQACNSANASVTMRREIPRTEGSPGHCVASMPQVPTNLTWTSPVRLPPSVGMIPPTASPSRRPSPQSREPTHCAKAQALSRIAGACTAGNSVASLVSSPRAPTGSSGPGPSASGSFGSGTYSIGSPRPGHAVKTSQRDCTPTPTAVRRAITPTEHFVGRPATPNGTTAWRQQHHQSPHQVHSMYAVPKAAVGSLASFAASGGLPAAPLGMSAPLTVAVSAAAPLAGILSQPVRLRGSSPLPGLAAGARKASAVTHTNSVVVPATWHRGAQWAAG